MTTGISQMRHVDLLAAAQSRITDQGGTIHLRLARMNRDQLIAWLRNDDARLTLEEQITALMDPDGPHAYMPQGVAAEALRNPYYLY